MYLEPSDSSRFYDDFVMRMNEFMGAIRSPDILKECVTISRDVMAAEYYRALTRCRKLLAYEQELLGHVGAGLPDRGEEE
jgi:flagellar biosynthesis repressor protein FlbT